MRLTGRTLDLVHSPIGEAHALVPLRTNSRKLLDLSQAAPTHAAPPAVVQAIAAAAAEPESGRYAPQPGLPELREVFAAELSADYQGQVSPDQVLITGGCNQAFCLAVSALAEPGDEIMIAMPYYFNHDMWLRLDGIGVVHLPTDESFVPDPKRAAELLTARTRAIVLVTPGNPTGVVIAPAVLAAFADLAAEHNVALIIDETYRTFRGTSEPAHELFGRDSWPDHVISLHSFSKDLAMPGYRVGAVVAGNAVITEVLKLLDCVAISASHIGQIGVLAGLEKAGEWRRAKQSELAALQLGFESVMATRPGGFELASSGAYFGWVKHNQQASTVDVTRRLVLDHDVLVIPGTAFTTTDQGFLRFSFANLAMADMDVLRDRLRELA